MSPLSMEDLAAIATVVQAAFVLPTLAFAAYQLKMQRQEMARQRDALGYDVYQRINSQNTEFLWTAAEDPTLDCIWEPMDPARKSELDQAQEARSWGAWHAMNAEERRCYRYTRRAIELVEQSWQIHELGMIDEATWAKWATWGSIWGGTRYFWYVIEDERPRLLSGFVEFLEAARPEVAAAETGSPVTGPSV